MYSPEEQEMARRYLAGEPLSTLLAAPAAAPAEPVETEVAPEAAAGWDSFSEPGQRVATPSPGPGPLVPPSTLPQKPDPLAGSHGVEGLSPEARADTEAKLAAAEKAAAAGKPLAPGAEMSGPIGTDGIPISGPSSVMRLPEVPIVGSASGGAASAGAALAPKAPSGPAGWLTKEMQSRGEAPPDGIKRVDPLGSPETVDERGIRNEAEGEGFSAMVDQGEAAIARGEQLGIKQAEADAADAGRLAENARRQQEHIGKLEEYETRARGLWDDYQNTKLDKDPYWNGLSTGEQIVKSIAVALGAAGSALTGAPNVAADMIKQRTEAALETQFKEKEGKLRRAMGEFTLIDAARARFEDEGVARAAAREAAYRNNVAEIEKWNATAKTPEQKAALEQMRAAANLELGEAERRRREETDRYLLMLMAPKGGGVVKKKTKPEMMIPGYGPARSVKSAEAGRELAAANEELLGMLGEAEKLRKQGATQGVWGVGTQAYKDADALRNRMLPVVAKINAGGFAATETDMDAAQGMVPDPTSWSDSTFSARAKALRTGVKVKTEGWMKQHVVPPEEAE